MKYHDILDIYVTASPEQIEKAYADKIAALNSCEASPLLKQKKTRRGRTALNIAIKALARNALWKLWILADPHLNPTE